MQSIDCGESWEQIERHKAEVALCQVSHCLLRSMHFCSGESSTLGGEEGDSESDEEESSDLSLPPSCSDSISQLVRSWWLDVAIVKLRNELQ